MASSDEVTQREEGPKTVVLRLRASPDQEDKLIKLAALRDTTVSDLLREHGLHAACSMYDEAVRASEPKTPA